MKHHDPLRPIGKCKGCCLNQKRSCAAGFEPKAEWNHGRCKHYGDEALLAQLGDQPAPSGAKAARLARKARAAAKATEPHHNGALDPGRMSGGRRRGGS